MDEFLLFRFNQSLDEILTDQTLSQLSKSLYTLTGFAKENKRRKEVVKENCGIDMEV